MQRLIDKFDRVYIHQDAEGSALATRARTIFPAEKIEIFSPVSREGKADTVSSTPFASSRGELSAFEFSRSKRNLYLTPFRGQFFKRCPGSRPGLFCCNYFVLNLGLQCDMNCSYCYLQSFINTPVLTIYTNINDAIKELSSLPIAHDQLLRIGTGETVDSLSLDDFTLYSRKLIEFFRTRPNWTLEFKTKSAKVDQFIDLDHVGNIIVSWSLNPQNIIDHEEHGTASLNQRLDAAEKCVRQKFPVSFHIDPMIYHPGWQESYGELVDHICARFTPEQIPVMSVGALRFQPEQRAIMRERFGMKSYVTSAEMFASRDGKFRYDASIREEMFSFVMNRFRAHSHEWRIFMCMETPETWSSTVGKSPFHHQPLKPFFDPKVTQIFG